MDTMDDIKNLHVKGMGKIENLLQDLYVIGEAMGLDPEVRIERYKIAWSHIIRLVDDLRIEEVEFLDDVKREMQNMKEQNSELAKILSVEYSPVDGFDYLKTIQELEKDSFYLEGVKQDRLNTLKKLMAEDNCYCNMLGIEQFKLPTGIEVPSREDLQELKQRVNNLSDNYAVRLEKYRQSRLQFAEILTLTEEFPETSFEKTLFENDEPVSLSDNTFQELNDTIDRANRKRVELEKTKRRIVCRLEVLRKRLGIEDQINLEFIPNHLDCRVSTLNAIQLEVDRYEEMKYRNLEFYFGSTHKELEELWVRCGASDDEKQRYDSGAVNQEALADLEAEVEKWRTYHENVKPILTKIQKRSEHWDSLKMLDNKAKDPERFKNRGGNLLTEERERNMLLKTLPSLEDNINFLIEKYESETGNKFTYFGEDFRKVMSSQRNNCPSYKENLNREKSFRTPLKLKKLTHQSSFSCPKSLAVSVSSTKLGVTPKSNRKVNPNGKVRILDEKEHDFSSSELVKNRIRNARTNFGDSPSRRVSCSRAVIALKRNKKTLNRRASIGDQSDVDSVFNDKAVEIGVSFLF